MIARYEKFFFFLSFTLMVLFFHFFVTSFNGISYQFPWAILLILIIPFFPSFISTPLFCFFKNIFIKIGHFNSMILYFIIYFIVLTPVGLIRKSRCDLAFKGSKNESFLIKRQKSQWDLDKPF